MSLQAESSVEVLQRQEIERLKTWRAEALYWLADWQVEQINRKAERFITLPSVATSIAERVADQIIKRDYSWTPGREEIVQIVKEELARGESIEECKK